MNEMNHHPDVIGLLELAEAGTLFADVPPKLRDSPVFSYGAAKKLFKITKSRRIPTGWSSYKTRKKKAHELREGDLIQFEPGDRQSYKVWRVTVTTHAVDVEGSGPPHRWSSNANVTVFDGPPPHETFIEEKPQLVLEPEGVAILAEHRLTPAVETSTSPNPAEALDNYRDERRPDGELLTVKFCETRYNVSGKDLHLAWKKDPSIRRKNPAGRGDVYRYDAVRDISDRKSRDE